MVYKDTQKMNVFGEIIVYLLSIVVPIGVILITKATGNISEIINIKIVRICLSRISKTKPFILLYFTRIFPLFLCYGF